MIGLVVLALATAGPLPPAPHTVKTSAENAPAWLAIAGGEAQVMAEFAAAEARRGPLEGQWRLADTDGASLYLFQLADSGGLPDPRAARPNSPAIEGAWLDLHRTPAADGVGPLASIRLDRGRLTLTFFEGGPPGERTVALHLADGAWRGDMTAAAGTVGVVMTREPLLHGGPPAAP